MSQGWVNALLFVLQQAKQDLSCLDAAIDKDDSWQDIALLIEASDNLNVLQYAYDGRDSGDVHVEVEFRSD
tara:strand:+ start:130 stop:342 length:213 start_codon:yes stop_codon:yes gene_type:complete